MITPIASMQNVIEGELNVKKIGQIAFNITIIFFVYNLSTY
ncbi:hypothetical protein LDG_8163 [Legionella drancourtii LLAP12]|uniref:Uncharacterized protein n=1 Tax=Legionella drancourtii LLAP12 TaxID=658187 RepID=G9ES90_9GAMM|nr:hypothetical protein LDG_8163 [Legionella drancourtii LLAP12]